MKKTAMLAALCLVAVACSGVDTVLTVDGVRYDIEDVPISTDAASIELDIFRNALNWLVADQVLSTAADEQFGITFDEAEVLRLAEAGLANADSVDPRTNLEYLKIQARFGQQGLLWPQLGQALPEGVLPIEWALAQLREAEVDVAPRYGEWRVDPEPAVYGP